MPNRQQTTADALKDRPGLEDRSAKTRGHETKPVRNALLCLSLQSAVRPCRRPAGFNRTWVRLTYRLGGLIGSADLRPAESPAGLLARRLGRPKVRSAGELGQAVFSARGGWRFAHTSAAPQKGFTRDCLRGTTP